jgi:aspartyl aminopeptidase
MNTQTLNQSLFSFISQSPSPFHAVRCMKNILDDAGFIPLNESADWKITAGQPHYIVREDGSLVAFNVGLKDRDTFRIVGSHSDSPCLQLKPKPDIYEKEYHQLGVEIYGGALLNPWFDRELSIAGRVVYQQDDNVICSRLLDFMRPIAVIPSLAIHLDRNANSEKNINSQKEIVPIIGLTTDRKHCINDIILDQLTTEVKSTTIKNILGFDLFLYDCQAPSYAGVDNEFILSSRLDNLLSCFVLVSAVSQANRDNSFMFVCNNHEEIGSNTASGAQGNLLISIFERLFPDPSDRHRLLANSFFISVDNAHAMHPNYTEKHEPSHDIALNRGPVLKINSTHKYATTGISTGIFKTLCAEKDIKVQEFVMRSDMACGSTIGPLTASKLGLKTVDIGAPSLAMHSIREMTGSRDPILMFTVLRHFLQRENLPRVIQSV